MYFLIHGTKHFPGLSTCLEPVCEENGATYAFHFCLLWIMYWLKTGNMCSIKKTENNLDVYKVKTFLIPVTPFPTLNSLLYILPKLSSVFIWIYINTCILQKQDQVILLWNIFLGQCRDLFHFKKLAISLKLAMWSTLF